MTQKGQVCVQGKSEAEPRLKPSTLTFQSFKEIFKVMAVY